MTLCKHLKFQAIYIYIYNSGAGLVLSIWFVLALVKIFYNCEASIMLTVNASCSYHFLWRCTLSERPLLLLVLLVVKQFTVPNSPQITLDCAEINNQMRNTVTNSRLYDMLRQIVSCKTCGILHGMLQQ